MKLPARLATMLLVLGGCTAPAPPDTGPPVSHAKPPPVDRSMDSASSAEESTGRSPTSTSRPTSTTELAAVPSFRWDVEPISDARALDMATSWRPGCPIELDDLRYVRLVHWGFDGQVHEGALVLAADVVDRAGEAWRALFDQRFPIRQVRPIDDFGGDDDASMKADNTSAFNCRTVAGTDRWSQHAYGRAIDLNPLENPYVRGGVVSPPGGRSFLDRSATVPGLLRADGPEVTAFARAGWSWGGAWTSGPDYQHFSATGH